MPRAKAALLWLALATLIAAAFAVAATSPLLQSRQPVYILAGFAGIAAMALLALIWTRASTGTARQG